MGFFRKYPLSLYQQNERNMSNKSYTAQDWANFNKRVLSGKQGKKIQWFDRMGLYKLDEERNVEIKLSEGGTSRHYTNYNVRIYNRLTGVVISTKAFNFGAYLECEPTSTRNGTYKNLEIISYVSLDWYIARPKATLPIEKAIFDYIAMF